MRTFEYDPEYHEYYPSPEMEREMQHDEQQKLYKFYYSQYENHAVAHKLSMQEVYGNLWYLI